MILFDPLLLMAIVIATALVPGTLIALPLLRKTGMRLPEIVGFGFILGVVLPALMLLIEVLFGVNFSLPLVLFNLIALSAAGIAWGVRERAFDFSAEAEFVRRALAGGKGERRALAYEAALYGALLVVVFLAFWVRVQSYTPIYQELDPYFYMYGTQQILTLGQIPVTDDTAWYPESPAPHRLAPLKMYLEAQWYSLYTGGGAYSNYILAIVANFYPPLAAALMAFGAFVLISQEYGRKFGVIAAALIAFLPATILKMAAGVAEIQPYGMFALFFFFGAYALAVKKGGLRLAVLAGLAYMTLSLGSQTFRLANPVLFIYIALQALLIFYTRGDLKKFIITNAVLSAAMVGSELILHTYEAGFISAAALMGTALIATVGATLFAAYHYWVGKNVKETEMKAYALAALYLAVALLLVFSPLGAKFKDYGRSALGAAVYTDTLQRTIAEQAPAGGDFQYEIGAIGLRLEGLIGDVLKPISDLTNFMIQTVGDNVANLLFDVGAKTSTKVNSLTLVFLFGAGVACLSGFGRSIANAFERRIPPSGLAILFALMIFPVAYVGLNKAKYTILLAVMMVVAASIVFGELALLLRLLVRWLFRSFALGGMGQAREYALAAASAVMLLSASAFAVMEFAGPPVGWSKSLVAKSLTPRYQDNPALYKEKFGVMCGYLKSAGSYHQHICGAADDPKFNDDINNQYASLLCMLSLMDELSKPEFTKADAESALGRLSSGDMTQDEGIAVRLRCSKMDEYWLDSMEWLRKNIGEGERVISWWDYGHWLNFFAQRKAVVRNDHANIDMIREVAHAYIDAPTEELADYMRRHDTRYALFDGELLMDRGGRFGGKYGALNYLSCARDNDTNVSMWPGQSQCEFDHLFENVYVPVQGSQQLQGCMISETQGIRGVVAYISRRTIAPDGRVASQLEPAYCIGKTRLKSGEEKPAAYGLYKRDENGDLRLHKGFLQPQGTEGNIYSFGMIYNDDEVWVTPEGIKSGWEDRTTKFYDSNLYRAWFLRKLPGFRLVYESDRGEVKIFELEDYTPMAKAGAGK